MTEFIREGPLIAIPFLIAIGKITKSNGMESKQILLLGIGIAIAIINGFITSTLTGWRYFVDAIFITEVPQGAVVAFASMGLYDTVKKTGETLETELPKLQLPQLELQSTYPYYVKEWIKRRKRCMILDLQLISQIIDLIGIWQGLQQLIQKERKRND